MRTILTFGMACAIAPQVAFAQATRVIEVPNVRPLPRSPVTDTLWMIGLDESAGPDSLFGVMASAAAMPDRHRLLVGDPQAPSLRVFDSATGNLVGQMGRRGRGPGEFRFAARATATGDGTVLAYDVGRGVIVAFDSAFDHVDEVRPPMPVSPESFLANDTLLVISGVVRTGPYSRRAIHVFERSDGRHRGSFGRLVSASSQVVSQTIGAGVLAWAHDGNLWYAQRAPYSIEKYTPNGELLLRIERENEFLPGAESAYRVTMDGRRMRIEADDYPVAVAILETAQGLLLHQVRTPSSGYVLDVYDRELRLRASWQGDMPVVAASLGGDRYLVNGRGPDNQFWVGVALAPKLDRQLPD